MRKVNTTRDALWGVVQLLVGCAEEGTLPLCFQSPATHKSSIDMKITIRQDQTEGHYAQDYTALKLGKAEKVLGETGNTRTRCNAVSWIGS